MMLDIDLGAVQETLLLPLWARAVETEKERPIVNDAYARGIVDRLDYDFSKFEAKPEIAENQQFMWALRAYHFDTMVSRFLQENPRATVINVGAGLDTSFQRVDDGRVLWVNIELPDVAALRQRLIPDSRRETTLAKSVFDFSWIEEAAELTWDRSILFMAAGVLFYFSTHEVEVLLRKLADIYPGAELVFDAISSGLWVWLTNWAIMRKSGLQSEARLNWHLGKASDLRKWVPSIEVMEEYSMFSRIPSTEGRSKKVKRDLRIAQLTSIYNMFHVRFTAR